MLQQDVFTDEMRVELNKWLKGEPPIGHYQADLFADQQAPDAHIWQAQGQEPPMSKYDGYPLIGLAMLFIICGGSVVAVWALFGYVLPTVVGWLFRAAGA